MEFSLAKMRLKDAAVIMNKKERCLPFLIATPKEGRGEKEEKEKETVEQEIEIVGEKTKASISVDLCKRVFNCMKIPTTTKNKKCGLRLKKKKQKTKPGSFVSGKQFKV